jgi:putative DNA primase/helicase
VVVATGNNVEILGDTCRRVLVVRLDSSHERPEERTDFRHRDLRAYVRQHRADLVVAALTMLRAWHVAGRPGDGARWGSFEPWSALIPSAIVFAGGANPMAARPTVMGIADSESSSLAALLDGWAKLATAEGMTAKSAIATLYPPERFRGSGPPDGHDDLREAIETLTTPQPGKPPSPTRLGYALRKYRRRVVAGRMFDCALDRTGIARWRVLGRPGAGVAGDEGDVSNPSREQGGDRDQGPESKHALHRQHDQQAAFSDDLTELGIGGGAE